MTKKNITPSVSRSVLFQLNRNSPQQAATIANVNEDGTVNLGILDGNGKPMAGPPTSIPLIQPGEEVPESGYFCRWPDHTIEQAEEGEDTPSDVSGGNGAVPENDTAGNGVGSQGGQHAASKTDAQPAGAS